MCHTVETTTTPKDISPKLGYAYRYCWATPPDRIFELDGVQQPLKFYSIFFNSLIVMHDENRAVGLDGELEQGVHGFHMFKNKSDAEDYKQSILDNCKRKQDNQQIDWNSWKVKKTINNAVLLRCRVRGFLAGGAISQSYYGQGTKTETWEYRKPVEVVG